jgi:hypothetical protein
VADEDKPKDDKPQPDPPPPPPEPEDDPLSDENLDNMNNTGTTWHKYK